MTYRDDFREASREYYWTLPRVLAWILFGAGGLMLVGLLLKVIFFPAAVVSTAITPQKAVTAYEFFHDAHNQVLARVGQIRGHKAIIAGSGDTSADERNRLRIELAAMQQSCRDLVAKYNANASKMHVDLFRGRSAPASINLTTCE